MELFKSSFCLISRLIKQFASVLVFTVRLMHAHLFPHFCFSVTLLDSRSVQGELGWVASPTEGGVSALKEVSPCWDAWSPIELKWRDNIHYWQELRAHCQIDTQPSLIRFFPVGFFMRLFVVDLWYDLCCVRIWSSKEAWISWPGDKFKFSSILCPSRPPSGARRGSLNPHWEPRVYTPPLLLSFSLTTL